MYRRTYLNVDLDAYASNINKLQEISNKKLIAVMKANAYGMGVQAAVEYALKAGIDFFATSSLEEALQVRQLAPKAEIQILGYVDLRFLDVVKENNFTLLTVYPTYFEKESNLSGVKVTLKIDTGMHRIGVLPQQAKEVLQGLLIRNADVVGIMTHFAKSDEEEEIYTKKQYELFKQCLADLNYPFRYIHTCNTDATMHFNDEISTHARCGIGMWGYSAFKGLKPAVSLFSEVISCKQVELGEPISYGGRFISDGSGYICTVPIGYADGVLRKYSGNNVYIDGELAPIVGSICMDQMMIHTYKPYSIGSKVEFFGEHISLYEMAEKMGSIPYEILTGISDRVSRRYLLEGKKVGEDLPRFH